MPSAMFLFSLLIMAMIRAMISVIVSGVDIMFRRMRGLGWACFTGLTAARYQGQKTYYHAQEQGKNNEN